MTEEELRRLIISGARSWIGTPYRHQASLKGVGCDCLGLVRGVWREVLGEEPEPVPAYDATWAEAGRSETLLEAAGRHMCRVSDDSFLPGDLLVFRWRNHVPAKHLAIAVDRDRMIHAQERAVVCEVSLNGWWRRHLAAAFSFPVTEG